LLDCYNGCAYACPLNEGGKSCQNCMNCFNNGVCDRFTNSSNDPCLCNNGFDPSINCKDCLPNLYGPQCNNTCTKNCSEGYHCSAGVNGTGNCVCNGNYNPATNCEQCLAHFDISKNCSDCIPTFYGSTCSNQCLENCYNGICSTGINGTGACICNNNYDPATNCSTIFHTSSKSIPSWEIPVIVSVSVGAVILIAIGITARYLGRKINKVFEEVVVGENIHAGEMVEYTTVGSSPVIETLKKTKSL